MSNSECTKQLTNNNRIEYIDAMRGFTMILVVVCHVAGFCLGIESDTPSIHPFLYEFRMPTFFFISGFVLYKSNQIWNCEFICKFLKKKFFVQIVTTAIFFLVYIHINKIPIIEGLYSDSKLGYWFTYSLFVYFIVYSICRWFLSSIKCSDIFTDLLLFAIGCLFYILFSVRSIFNSLPLNHDIENLLSMQHWGYFLFFIIGTLFKKHISIVLHLLDKKHIILACLLIFFCFNLFYEEIRTVHVNLFNICTAISGIVLVFSFFRIHQKSFLKEKFIGNCLQYIGRRTLDIYLLHYLLLPVNLYVYSDFLRNSPMPIIEFTITIIISLIVIGGCLIISSILRMSSMLSYLLFGVKKSK